MAFDPKGRTVTSGADDGFLRCFAVPTGKSISKVRGQGVIRAVRYAPDGDTVFFGTDKGVWRAQVSTGEVIEQRPCQPRIMSLQLSADGHTLLAGCSNGTVRLWRLEDADSAPRVIRVGVNSVGALGVRRDGRLLATGDHAGILCLVDLRNGTVIAKTEKAHRASINGVGFGAKEEHLFSVGADARLKIWKLNAPSR